MVIEVVRGLGLGGAESLLAMRLESESRSGELRTSKIVNTYSGEDFFADQLVASGVSVLDLRTSSRWVSALKLWRLARSFPAGEPIVVHSPWPAAVLKLRRALHRSNAPLVEVAHSTRYATPMVILGLVLNRFATSCIAVSDEVASATTTRGFRSKKVVLSGVDRTAMREWIRENPTAPDLYRARIGLPPGARLIASVGNLLPLKRHSLLLKGMTELDQDVHLVLAGRGPEEPRLRAQALELGISERVHMLGREPDAWRWMAVADLVAHPSAVEGLPIALAEARVLGVPVLAFDVGGVTTILGGVSGSMVLQASDEEAFAEALIALIEVAPPVSTCFPDRASMQSPWDIERYATQFYAEVLGD